MTLLLLQPVEIERNSGLPIHARLRIHWVYSSMKSFLIILVYLESQLPITSNANMNRFYWVFSYFVTYILCLENIVGFSFCKFWKSQVRIDRIAVLYGIFVLSVNVNCLICVLLNEIQFHLICISITFILKFLSSLPPHGFLKIYSVYFIWMFTL